MRASAPPQAMNRLLMIAYHFPPLAGSSGIQRTLGFARHLPRFGWDPLILTAHPRAYERVSPDLLSAVPSGMVVEQAFALDTARHLSVMGRFPRLFARPDRWITWWLGAVPAGLSMIRKYRPRAIWSTYPIATAHGIGATLHRLSRLPWIADFRDPMAQDGYPEDPATWRSFKRIEEATLANASRSIFVTEGAARFYRERYAAAAPRVTVIENGYDEQLFDGLDKTHAAAPLVPGRTTVVHSGIVYPIERDPTQFFQALRRMLDDRSLLPGTLVVRLRAAAHESLLRRMIDDVRVAEVVELAPPIPYREALQEMLRADGLLVLQAANCNDQIPAKVYEYLRCRRPIIALTDPVGDTARLLRHAGVHHVARLDSVDEIASRLAGFLQDIRNGSAPLPAVKVIEAATRAERTRELAGVLEEVRT